MNSSNNKLIKLEKIFPKIKKDILLGRYTTFGLGGKADYFLEVDSVAELKEALSYFFKNKVSFFILGGGSNLLISDNGYRGVIIKMKGKELELRKEKTIIVEAGVSLAKLVYFAMSYGLSGFEWAAGIPGTVGGAIRGNAGAFGKSMADNIKLVEVVNAKSGKINKFRNEECKFNYRESIFKKNSHLVVIRAEIALDKKDKSEIEKQSNEYFNYRKERQPQGYSAGSVFKNYKIKNKKEREALIEKNPEIEKVIKDNVIPAAFLIDKCGLKGKKVGRVMISLIHANFIINLGRGKSEDVTKLIYLIKKEVSDKFGIIIEEEIQYLGF
ncbi:MAG: UDP-N-acetylmuramate dehydrogenase [Candidatus Nealsonbacteria bacterium]|nr:UDP-N-acetylmuramate dehydrogenase [Candidatus Nealsonbacteria bacterium]